MPTIWEEKKNYHGNTYWQHESIIVGNHVNDHKTQYFAHFDLEPEIDECLEGYGATFGLALEDLRQKISRAISVLQTALSDIPSP